MKVSVTIKEMNSDFDQEYADEYKDGKESDNNLKSNWETSFGTDDDVTEIKLKDNTIFSLNGSIGKEIFAFQIPDMQVLECVTAQGKTLTFAVSNKLITRTHQVQNKKYKRTHYYFYLTDKVEHIKFTNTIIIAKADIPTDFLQKLLYADT